MVSFPALLLAKAALSATERLREACACWTGAESKGLWPGGHISQLCERLARWELGLPATALEDAHAIYSAGAPVEMLFSDGLWYKGRATRVDRTTLDVRFHDGEEEDDVPLVVDGMLNPELRLRQGNDTSSEEEESSSSSEDDEGGSRRKKRRRQKSGRQAAAAKRSRRQNLVAIEEVALEADDVRRYLAQVQTAWQSRPKLYGELAGIAEDFEARRIDPPTVILRVCGVLGRPDLIMRFRAGLRGTDLGVRRLVFMGAEVRGMFEAEAERYVALCRKEPQPQPQQQPEGGP